MPTTYIRSADETHQVHVAVTPDQHRCRLWGHFTFGNRPHRALVGLRYDGPELPVLPCPDLDAWLDEQMAEKARQHAAYLAEVPIRQAAAAAAREAAAQPVKVAA